MVLAKLSHSIAIRPLLLWQLYFTKRFNPESSAFGFGLGPKFYQKESREILAIISAIFWFRTYVNLWRSYPGYPKPLQSMGISNLSIFKICIC